MSPYPPVTLPEDISGEELIPASLSHVSCVLFIYLYQLLNEASLMTIGLGANLCLIQFRESVHRCATPVSAHLSGRTDFMYIEVDGFVAGLVSRCLFRADYHMQQRE